MFNKVTIVGLGLLGGSFALSIKKLIPGVSITGVDISMPNATKALELGLANQIGEFEVSIKDADLIVIATPVDCIPNQVIQCLDQLKPGAIVCDLGSTKLNICEAVKHHPKRNQFIATHPIAGTENSGPEAAFASLLENKKIILCDIDLTESHLLNQFKNMLTQMKMQVEYMSSASHDKHIAYVSHLSHISSFGLGATVLDIEKNERNIFIMAGSGFASTVRLAKSSPDMWTPIFSQNRENISAALNQYIQNLTYFKSILDENNLEKIHQFMSETNDIRRVLDAPPSPKKD